MIDEEISRIVRDSQRLADEILRKDIKILHSLGQELLKYETIDSKDLKVILDGKKLTRPLNGRKNPNSYRRNPKREKSKANIKYPEKKQTERAKKVSEGDTLKKIENKQK